LTADGDDVAFFELIPLLGDEFVVDTTGEV